MPWGEDEKIMKEKKEAFKDLHHSQMDQHASAIPEVNRQRQEDHEFQASLCCVARSCQERRGEIRWKKKFV